MPNEIIDAEPRSVRTRRAADLPDPDYSKYDPDPPIWRIGGDWLEYDPEAHTDLRARDFVYRIVGAALVIAALALVIGLFFNDGGDHSTVLLAMTVAGSSALASGIRDLARLLRYCGHSRPGDNAHAWSRLYHRFAGLFDGSRTLGDHRRD